MTAQPHSHQNYLISSRSHQRGRSLALQERRAHRQRGERRHHQRGRPTGGAAERPEWRGGPGRLRAGTAQGAGHVGPDTAPQGGGHAPSGSQYRRGAGQGGRGGGGAVRGADGEEPGV